MRKNQVKKTLLFLFFSSHFVLFLILGMGLDRKVGLSLAIGLSMAAISFALSVMLSAEIFGRDKTGLLTVSKKLARVTVWLLGSAKFFILASIVYVALEVWDCSAPWLVAGAGLALGLTMWSVWMGGKPGHVTSV